ncbi:MAG TPA: hypothetical protein VN042_02710 [Asticcacaulis sp.]|nr:hypothetical protein [Asticcacaulis sp.]
MKQSALLLSLMLAAAPPAAGWASHAQAEPHFDAADQHQRRGRDKDDDAQGQRPQDDAAQRRPPPNYRPQGGENRRDDRINRAIAAGEARGHVLDAGQQDDSTFWVRVDTGHGRVDLLVDGQTGRVVGER